MIEPEAPADLDDGSERQESGVLDRVVGVDKREGAQDSAANEFGSLLWPDERIDLATTPQRRTPIGKW